MVQDDFFTISNTNIQTLAPVEDLAFFDKQSIYLPKSIGPLEAWEIIKSRPMPLLKLAFRIRDTISALFGVKRIGGFTAALPKTVKVGQKLDFFVVEHIFGYSFGECLTAMFFIVISVVVSTIKTLR